MKAQSPEQLRRCWSCDDGVMRCSLLVQHTVNGGDTGQSYHFICDGCGASVTDRTPVQMLSMLMTLPAAGLFGAFLFFMPLSGVIDKFMRGSFRFDFGGIVILCMLGLGLITMLGTAWGSFAFMRNQVRLGKAKVIRS